MADYSSKIAYDTANTIQIKMKLNKKTDRDIIEYLEESRNKQGAIKEALRYYMFQESGEEKNLKWAVIDSTKTDEFMTVCHSLEEALAEADDQWDHLTKYDKEERTGFIVGLVNVEYRNGGWDNAELPGGIIDADVYEVAKKYK